MGRARAGPAERCSHTYGSVGALTASVTVTDSLGRSASASALVTVNAVPVIIPPPPPPPPPTPPLPTLSATVTWTIAAHGSPTDCNVTAHYGGITLGSATVTGVGWDFGDGSTTHTTVPAVAYIFPIAGTYTLFAYVDDTPSPSIGPLVIGTSLVITIP